MTLMLDTNTLLDDERALIRSYVEAAVDEDVTIPDDFPILPFALGTGIDRVEFVLTALMNRLKEEREYALTGWTLFCAIKGIERDAHTGLRAASWEEWQSLDRAERIRYGKALASLRTDQ